MNVGKVGKQKISTHESYFLQIGTSETKKTLFLRWTSMACS